MTYITLYDYNGDMTLHYLNHLLECDRDKDCAKEFTILAIKEIFKKFPCEGCSQVGLMVIDFWDDITNKILGKPYNEERYKEFLRFIDEVNKGTVIKE